MILKRCSPFLHGVLCSGIFVCVNLWNGIDYKLVTLSRKKNT